MPSSLFLLTPLNDPHVLQTVEDELTHPDNKFLAAYPAIYLTEYNHVKEELEYIKRIGTPETWYPNYRVQRQIILMQTKICQRDVYSVIIKRIRDGVIQYHLAYMADLALFTLINGEYLTLIQQATPDTSYTLTYPWPSNRMSLQTQEALSKMSEMLYTYNLDLIGATLYKQPTKEDFQSQILLYPLKVRVMNQRAMEVFDPEVERFLEEKYTYFHPQTELTQIGRKERLKLAKYLSYAGTHVCFFYYRYQIVGYLEYSIREVAGHQVCELHEIYVTAFYRHKGYGTSVFKYFLATLNHTTATDIIIHTPSQYIFFFTRFGCTIQKLVCKHTA